MHKTDHKDGGTTIKGVKGSDTCRKSTGASHDSGLAMAGKFPSLADPSEKEAVTYGPGGDPSESDDADEEEEEEDDGADGNSEEESFVDTEEIDGASAIILSSSNALSLANLHAMDPETRSRIQTLIEATGIGKITTAEGQAEVLRELTSSVSSALDEATAALTRMRTEQPGEQIQRECIQSLAQACTSGDIETVRHLLKQGRSVNESTEDGESLLSLAASSGYYELCQVLIAVNANVEDRGAKGDCTPLMEAACAGFSNIIKLLTANGANVNAKSSAGNTALHYAACNGHESAVQALIEAGANVEEHNENGHTPLMEAASAGRVGVARLLLDAGAGINTHSNEFKESALTLACYKGHLEMVKFLLAAGADQEHKTDEMHTALMEASMDGHVEVARLLMDSGAQVNMPTDSFESPLTLAACGGHVELANLLIERGANLEEANDEGYTPLMEAAREGHEEMCALLLAHGADINAQTEETQETALTLACCGGFLEVVDFLVKAGADLELGCSTPLMEAAQEGHLDLVKFLLKCGANINAKTQTGDNALTYACENGHTDVVELLLKNGMDLEHESEGGRTPLMKAARVGHLCTVQYLISQGADVNKPTTNNDHTVLSLACAGGHLNIVELLLKKGANASHKLKDGSTMLIEASKGGHAQVVKLLLDWTGSSNSSPSDELSQSSLSQSSLDLQQIPRVPMQGLNNVVPPPDPAVSFCGPSAIVSALPDDRVWSNASAQSLFPAADSHASCCYQGPLTNLLKQNQTLSNPAKVVDPLLPKEHLHQPSCKFGVDENLELKLSEKCKIAIMGESSQSSDNVAVLSAFLATNGTPSPSPGLGDMKVNEQLKGIFSMLKKLELYDMTPEEQTAKKQQLLEKLHRTGKVENDQLNLLSKTSNFLSPEAFSIGEMLQQQQQQQQGFGPNALNLSPASTIQKPPSLPVRDYSQSSPCLQQPFQNCFPLRDNNTTPSQSESQASGTSILSSSGSSGREQPSFAQLAFSAEITEDITSKDDLMKLTEKSGKEAAVKSNESHEPGPESKRQDGDGGGPTEAEKVAGDSAKKEMMPSDASCNYCDQATGEGAGTTSDLDMSFGLNGDELDLSTIMLLTELQANQSQSQSPQQVFLQQNSLRWHQQPAQQPQQQHAEEHLWSPHHLEQMIQLGALQWQHQIVQEDPRYQLPTVSEQDLLRHQQQIEQQLLMKQQQLQQQQQQQQLEEQMQLLKQQVGKLEFRFDSQPQPPLTCNQQASVTQQQPPLPPPQQQQQQQQQLQQHDVRPDGQRQNRVFVKGHRKLQQQKPPQLQVQQQQQQQMQVQQQLQVQQLQAQQQQQQNLSLMSSAQYILDPYAVQMQGSNAPGGAVVVTSTSADSASNEAPKSLVWQQRTQTQLDLAPNQQPKAKQARPGNVARPVQQQQNLSQTNGLLLGAKQQQQQPMALSHQPLMPNCLFPNMQQPQQQQHICLPTYCGGTSVGTDLQQLKQLHPGQQLKQGPFSQQYLQQHELLQQAQQLQYQLQTAHQLQQLLQHKQGMAPAGTTSGQLVHPAGGAAVGSASQLTTQDLLHQAQQFQQALQAQQFQQHQKQLKQVQMCGLAPGTQPTSVSMLNTVPFQTGFPGNMQKIANKGNTQIQYQPNEQQQFQLHQISQQLGSLDAHIKSSGTVGTNASTNSGFECVDAAVTPSSSSAALSPNCSPASPQGTPQAYSLLEVDAQTEANHDTALTLACSGGHTELVSLLLSRRANIEHRDKKGFTPLILAATGGHKAVVEILLENSADIEAQSERTKDSALSLACSSGRFEVVELLLTRGANKEHRNVSDYTPLSLAASGGFVNIIKLLLNAGAEINSRTGSKLGISPLMLAAMNGHVQAVSLLLDMGSDINAQIETNRNTALTLACFQGRHDVVSLLVDRKANIEHRAKTGLTPLMEAASGGYVEVGKVLLDKGADVNAPPVPSSRDTALTIAADKGHFRFVELLINRKAAIDVKNKKGNSPLWLACNGGHLEVVQLLVNAKADVDSQDNRKVSCLMAAFRKGHVKVVKWLVRHVTQFPSDLECQRTKQTITDKELLKKCQQCMELIVSAKDRQAAEANKNANNLLQELALEESRKESKKAALARKREKKRQKKKKKQESEKDQSDINGMENGADNDQNDDDSSEDAGQPPVEDTVRMEMIKQEEPEEDDTQLEKENSLPINNPDTKLSGNRKSRKSKKNSKNKPENKDGGITDAKGPEPLRGSMPVVEQKSSVLQLNHAMVTPILSTAPMITKAIAQVVPQSIRNENRTCTIQVLEEESFIKKDKSVKSYQVSSFTSTGIGDLDDFVLLPSTSSVKISLPQSREQTTESKAATQITKPKAAVAPVIQVTSTSRAMTVVTTAMLRPASVTSPKKGSRREQGWTEVTRKCRKINVPGKSISRIIGRAGCNINRVREASGAHIDLDKLKNSSDGIMTIRGSVEATRLAYDLIETLLREPDKDIEQIIPMFKLKNASAAPATTAALFDSATMNPWKNSTAKLGLSVVGCTNLPSTLTTTANKLTQCVTVSGVQTLPHSSVVGTGGSLNWINPVGSHAGEEVAKPQLIQSFEIGAWTPVSVAQHQAKRTGSFQGGRTSSAMPAGARKDVVTSSACTVASSVTGLNATVQQTASVQLTTVSVAHGRTETAAGAREPTKNLTSAEISTSRSNAVGNPIPMTKLEHLPLPIVTSGQMVTHSFSGKENFSGHVDAAPMVRGEYSPFNNSFSGSAILKGKENRMNFASVAAAGVVLTCAPSQVTSSLVLTLPSSDTTVDSALQAKAPGYRPIGQQVVQTVSSPQRVEVGGHKSAVTSSDNAAQDHGPIGGPYAKPFGYGGSGSKSVESEPKDDLSPVNNNNIGQEHIGAESHPMLQYMDGALPGMSSSKPSSYLSDSNDSPRSQSHREEYTSSKNPMTLPHIDSNLNPNAPDFTSKTASSLPATAKIATVSDMPGPFFFPQHPVPLPMHYGPLPSMSTALPFGLHPGTPAMMAQRFSDGMALYAPPPTDCIQVPSLPHTVITSEMLSMDVTPHSGVYLRDGMVPVVTAAEDGTPTSSSPPSPNTEQLHEERRLIRPIGTERSTKKQRILTSQGPGYNFILNSMAPIPQWSTCQIASDGSGDWIRGSTASAPASLISGPQGDGADECAQMMSVPPPAPQALMPQAFGPEMMAQAHSTIMDSLFDRGLQNQPALMSHGGHPIFTNGMMPGPLPTMNPGAPFYAASGTAAVLSDAGGHVDGSWENQHLKLPGGGGVPLADHHVAWSQWLPNH